METQDDARNICCPTTGKLLARFSQESSMIYFFCRRCMCEHGFTVDMLISQAARTPRVIEDYDEQGHIRHIVR